MNNRAMKDSGVEWMGEIPKDWEVKKIGSIYQERSTKVSDTEYPPLSVTKKGVFPQLENVAKTKNGDNRKLVKAGDFVINSRSDRKGSSGISDFDGSVSVINTVLCPKDTINNLYYNFLFKSNRFTEEFYKWGNGIVEDLWSTKWSKMKKISISIPPLHEQQAIASYLDDKVSRLDQLIQDQQMVIEEWKAYKQSLITETVTKGLNPEVELKDSGIEWIGEIPSHWDKTKITNVFKNIGSGTTPKTSNPDYFIGGKIKWLNTGDLNDSYLLETSKNVTNLAMSDYPALKLHPKDSLIVAMYGATIGKLGITTFETTTNQACCVLSNPKNCVLKFVFYYFLSFKSDIIQLSQGAGQPNISQKIIKSLPLFKPPLHEQQQIADFLDDKCSKIDQLIEDKQRLIEDLKTYKQSLIYECVTGKKEIV